MSTDTEPTTHDHARVSPVGRAARIGGGLLLVGAAPTAMAIAGSSTAGASTTITVTNTNDSGSGSLRDAIDTAVDGDIIDLTGVSGTITLTSGPLNWDTTSTITGPGDTILNISGNNSTRIFNIAANSVGDHVLSGVRLLDGSSASGGAIWVDSTNLAVDLTLDAVVVTGNSAVNGGGGVFFKDAGDLVIQNSYFRNNSADKGGGVYFYDSNDITITDTTFVYNHAATDNGGGAFLYGPHAVTFSGTNWNYNTAGGDGGAFWLYGSGTTATTVTENQFGHNTAGSDGGAIAFNEMIDGQALVTGSTFTSNNATARGGAVFTSGGGSGTRADETILASSFFYGNSAGTMGGAVFFGSGQDAVVNSTITGNSAVKGGAIAISSASQTTDILFATIFDNESTTLGGGIYVVNSPNLTISGSIVSYNNAHGGTGSDIDGNPNLMVPVDRDHSVIGTVGAHVGGTVGAGVVTSSQPGINSARPEGGPTLTAPLQAGSPARGIGPSTWEAFPGDSFDQRGTGYARIVSGVVDAGAWEDQTNVPPTTTTSSTSTTSTSTTSTSTTSTSTTSTSTTSTSSTSTTSTSSTSTTSTSTTSTTIPTPTTSTTIDVGPDGPATPTDGQPLDMAPGDAVLLEPDGSVVALSITQTGPSSIRFGTNTIGVDLSGSSVSNGADLGLTVGGNGTGSGFGFLPGSTASVWIMSTPQRLGTATVGSDGTFTSNFIVPADLVSGEHTVQLQGIGSDGEPRALAAGVTVSGGSALPSTGRNLTVPVGLGASLLLAGGLGVVASRRAQRPIGRHAR